MEFIPSERGTRLEGPTRMDMVSLVVHGLSAMAVFGDRIGVRLLIVVSVGMGVTVTALATCHHRSLGNRSCYPRMGYVCHRPFARDADPDAFGDSGFYLCDPRRTQCHQRAPDPRLCSLYRCSPPDLWLTRMKSRILAANSICLL